MAASAALMLYIFLATKIAWTWYVFIGSLTTLLVAWVASFVFTSNETRSETSAL
jgi:hypothetical protein